MSMPRWMSIGLELWRKALQASDAMFADEHDPENLQVDMIRRLATGHLGTCLETSNFAIQKEQNFYSVAICILRQCVETLSIIDLGLQPGSFSHPLLERWETGKLSHGDLRKQLEQQVWPRYGSGLWSEPWPEFFGNLARAVQPYAHYTPDLLGWQVKVADYRGGSKFIANLAPRAHDPIKTSRIAIVQAIITWSFARLLIENRPREAAFMAILTGDLRNALATSKLLWARKDWGTQLMPHVLYGPEAQWEDR